MASPSSAGPSARRRRLKDEEEEEEDVSRDQNGSRRENGILMNRRKRKECRSRARASAIVPRAASISTSANGFNRAVRALDLARAREGLDELSKLVVRERD